MRICYLAPAYHPIVGGAETYVKTIAEGMASRGHEVTVVTDNRENLEPYIELNGVRLFRVSKFWKDVNDITKIRWEQLYFSLLAEIGEIVDRNQFDIIHANSLDTSLLASMIGFDKNIPIISTIHEQHPEKEPVGKGKCDLVYQRSNIAKFIAGSEFYYNKALGFTVPEKIQLIYHGVDSKKFYPATKKDMSMREKFNIPEDAPLFLSAARLKERKGLLELIQAFSKVLETNSNAHLIIAGSCNSASREYADGLYKEIEIRNLKGKVQITEEITHEQMPFLMRASDIVVQPSHAEGLGLSVIEALATGKPVISTNIEGIIEIIDNSDIGCLVEPKNVESLSKACIEILANSIRRNELARNGYERFKNHFSLNNQLSQTESIYRGIINDVK